MLIAPETITANPVKITMELLPVETNIATTTPTNNVKVEINPSFNT